VTRLLASACTTALLALVIASSASAAPPRGFASYWYRAFDDKVICQMWLAGSQGQGALCTNPTTLTIDSNADCGSPSSGVVVTEQGQAQLKGVCERPGLEEMIPFIPNKTWELGNIHCSASMRAITCRHTHTHHGFTIRPAGRPRMF
jgi:hypothetical protein